MTDEFIVFGAPDIQQAEIDEVVDSLHAGWLGTGPKVKRFESDFATYKGVEPNRTAALNSCTAALHISLLAANIEPGDEVISTAMTSRPLLTSDSQSEGRSSPSSASRRVRLPPIERIGVRELFNS